MHVDTARLEALAAVVREGTFDGAARALHVTPSAVSQRIRALEEGVGQVVVRRSKPCRPTPAGEVLLRLAGQIELLGRDTAAELDVDEQRAHVVVVVVNADSLSTWFMPALASLRGGAVRFWVEQQDESHSAALLRDGTAMAAVTADARPVQGCRVEPLGALRFVAVAAPAFVAEHLRGRALARSLPVAPRVDFDPRDRLQDLFCGLLGADPAAPRDPSHRVPSSGGFLDAIRAGLGWGVAPALAVEDDLARGTLARIAPQQHLDVPLYWQHWRVRSSSLDALGEAVRREARLALVRDRSAQPRGPRPPGRPARPRGAPGAAARAGRSGGTPRSRRR